MENDNNSPETMPENPAVEEAEKTASEPASAEVPAEPNTQEPPAETVYEFGRIEGVDGLEGFERRVEAFDNRFKALAKETGLSLEAASKIRETMIREQYEAISKAIAAENERIAEADKALRQDWGADYDANLKCINAMVAAVDGKENGEMRRFLSESGMDNNPQALKVFKKMADHFKEDGNVPPKGELPPKDETMEEYVRARRLAAHAGMVH